MATERVGVGMGRWEGLWIKWSDELEDRFQCPHELGGVPTFVLTRALWEKHKANKNVGIRPAAELFPEVIEANEVLHMPAKLNV